MRNPVSRMHELYLQRSNLRPASIDVKQRACRYFIEWFGDPPVGRVTSAIAEDYRTMLGRGRGATTVNTYLENHRAFWTWLLRHGYITKNPFALVGRVKVDEQPPKQTFTPRELAALMMVADDLWRIRICFGLQGGRRGEVLSIQVKDVYLDEQPAHVLLGAKEGSGRTLPWGTKGRRLRLLAVPVRMGFDGIIVPLRQLVTERCRGRDGQSYICLGDERHELLVKRQRSGSLRWADLRDTAGNFPRQFRALQKAAGIQTLRRFHELRAAFITSMISHPKMGLSRASKLAGHKSVEQTQKYDRKEQLSLVAEASEITENTYVTNVS